MRALAVWPWLKPAWYWFTNDDEAEREIRSGRTLVFLGGIPVSLVVPCLLAEWKGPRIHCDTGNFAKIKVGRHTQEIRHWAILNVRHDGCLSRERTRRQKKNKTQTSHSALQANVSFKSRSGSFVILFALLSIWSQELLLSAMWKDQGHWHITHIGEIRTRFTRQEKFESVRAAISIPEDQAAFVGVS
jgi:hypothetical protein